MERSLSFTSAISCCSFLICASYSFGSVFCRLRERCPLSVPAQSLSSSLDIPVLAPEGVLSVCARPRCVSCDASDDTASGLFGSSDEDSCGHVLEYFIGKSKLVLQDKGARFGRAWDKSDLYEKTLSVTAVYSIIPGRGPLSAPRPLSTYCRW